MRVTRETAVAVCELFGWPGDICDQNPGLFIDEGCVWLDDSGQRVNLGTIESRTPRELGRLVDLVAGWKLDVVET